MKPRVYVETSVPSYLTARPSRNQKVADDQQATRDWWDRRAAYELFISPAVIQECRDGDPTAAAERMAALAGIPVLDPTDAVAVVAGRLLAELGLPRRAEVDAVHIATAAENGMNYLVTWNCTHMANPALLPRIAAVVQDAGWAVPIICTPRQLMGG